MPQINQGPGPTPRRAVNPITGLVSDAVEANLNPPDQQSVLNPDRTFINPDDLVQAGRTDPNTRMAGVRGTTDSTLAALLEAEKQRTAQLQAAADARQADLEAKIAAQESLLERRLQEMELNRFSPQPFTPPQAQLPQGADPNVQLTLADAAQLAANISSSTQRELEAVRKIAKLRLTTEEESAILQKYPHVGQFDEWNKAQFYEKALPLIRQAASTPAPQQSQSPAPNQSLPPNATLTTQRTVPLVSSETASASGLAEPAGEQTDRLIELNRLYETAGKIRNFRERYMRQREISMEIARLTGQGVDTGKMFGGTKFTQGYDQGR